MVGGGGFIGKDEQETTQNKKGANQFLFLLLHHIEDEALNENRLKLISRTLEQPGEF